MRFGREETQEMSSLGKKFSVALDAWKKVQELKIEDDDVILAISQVDGLSEKLDETLADLSKHFVVILKQLRRSQRDRSPVRKASPESRPYTVYYEVRNGDNWIQSNDVEVPSADPFAVKRELLKRYHRALAQITDQDGVAVIPDAPFFAGTVVLRRAYTDEEIKLEIDWSDLN